MKDYQMKNNEDIIDDLIDKIFILILGFFSIIFLLIALNIANAIFKNVVNENLPIYRDATIWCIVSAVSVLLVGIIPYSIKLKINMNNKKKGI